jgi:hypothetical protein
MDLSIPLEDAKARVVFGRPCARHVNEAPFARPYRKQHALLISTRGACLGLAKIALEPAADELLAREAQWLRELEDVRELEGQVPRVLEEGRNGDGRRYLVSSVSPLAGETRALAEGHVRFLAALGRARFRASDFELSGCCETLQRAMRRLEPCAGREDMATLQEAYLECEAALLYWTGPYVVSQGDFAPWNIRVAGERLFVLDWENAHAHASPLDDVLHYLVVPRMLKRNPLGICVLQSAMRRAREFALAIYREWPWREPVVGALTLVYLLGAVVRHALARGRLDRSHPMVGSYWRLIERRALWMPC